jgi:hypothetical protein
MDMVYLCENPHKMQVAACGVSHEIPTQLSVSEFLMWFFNALRRGY